jgi:hypothetical protein
MMSRELLGIEAQPVGVFLSDVFHILTVPAGYPECGRSGNYSVTALSGAVVSSRPDVLTCHANVEHQTSSFATGCMCPTEARNG